MSLTIMITDLGRQALVNATHTGTNEVLVSEVGLSQTAITPTADLTALAGELKRVSTVSGEAVALDTIHMTLRDSSADVYSLRSFALYLDDGTLFAIYGQPTPIMEKTAYTSLYLVADIAFVDVLAPMITFGDAGFLNPPATEDMSGVVELATNAEAQTGTDAVRAITPKSLLFAFTAWFTALTADVWRASNDGSGSGLDADLLDGQHGAYYANITARLGYTPLNVTAYTAADVMAKVQTLDGSGSGLDADLLDGYHASVFRRVVASSIVENGGYLAYSDGTIETWGFITVAQDTSGDYYLPYAHTSWVNVSVAHTGANGTSASENVSITSVNGAPPSSITFFNSENRTNTIWVRTIGK